MYKLLLALMLPFSILSQPCVDRECAASTNFSADLKGVPDYRPDTWGTADYIIKKITFKAIPGHRVRIKKVYGDFLVWPIGKVEPGKFAGTLLGLQTTAPEGSVHADWAADNTFLYMQAATGGAPERLHFSEDTSVGGLLQPDNVMIVKMAVWLNDTGLTIHMEPSFTFVYQYEKEYTTRAVRSNPCILGYVPLWTEPVYSDIDAKAELQRVGYRITQ